MYNKRGTFGERKRGKRKRERGKRARERKKRKRGKIERERERERDQNIIIKDKNKKCDKKVGRDKKVGPKVNRLISRDLQHANIKIKCKKQF